MKSNQTAGLLHETAGTEQETTTFGCDEFEPSINKSPHSVLKDDSHDNTHFSNPARNKDKGCPKSP